MVLASDSPANTFLEFLSRLKFKIFLRHRKSILRLEKDMMIFFVEKQRNLKETENLVFVYASVSWI